MPFCPSCGKENAPGKNFCEECGAPLKRTGTPPAAGTPPPPSAQPALAPVPAPPSPPEAAPPSPAPVALPGPGTVPPPAGKKGGIPKAALIGIGVVIVIILATGVYLIAPSALSGLSGMGAGQQAPPVPTPGDTPAAPLTTALQTTRATATPAPLQTLEARYEETYEVIYSSDRQYRFGEKVTFPHTLVRPPLSIKFAVTPAMANVTKLVDIGLSSEHEIVATYPDPKAWFEVKVLDAAGGGVAATGGFGASKGYSVNTKQEFMVRTAGDYIVEMSGNMVTAAVQVRIGKS